jgi:hypothetical protein
MEHLYVLKNRQRNFNKNIKIKNNLIIIIRGHIRDSFDNNNLYKYILNLSINYKLYIFIHTWNIKSNNISWRSIEENHEKITEEIIIKYFKNINIEKIFIDNDNDNDISLIGNIDGNIKTTLMPIKGWKNMWFGIYKINEYVLNNLIKYNLDVNTYCLNIRFDYFTNSTINQYNINDLNYLYNFTSNDIQFIKNLASKNIPYGIDNIYFGKFYKIFYTAKIFNFNLDDIIKYYDYIHAQEYLVYDLQKYINIYCDDNIYDNEDIDLTIKMILMKLKNNKLTNKKENLDLNENFTYLTYN